MATTLANLRTSVRIELRDPDGITSTDTMINYAINQAYRKAFMHVVKQAKDYFVTTTTHDIVAGTRAYANPTDHLTTKYMEYVAPTATIPLFRYTRGITVNPTSGTGYPAGVPAFTYDFEGDNFVLEPTPTISLTAGIKHTYYPTAATLSSDSSVINAGFKDIWVDVIVLEAARICLSQIEARGGIVSDEFAERLKEARETMDQSLRLRDVSPRLLVVKGYFQ